jgi:two-component system chemotaxis sensor kinase CheA
VAFPTAAVERLVRVRAGDVRRVDGRDVLPDPAGPVPLVPLSRLLGVASAVPGEAPEAHPVVRLAAGGRRVAVVVDAWLHEEEVLVRPLRGVREPPPFAAGASILATGEVALVLNAAALVDAGLAGEHGAPAVAPSAASGARAPRLLVVDDSITTRALEQSILEAAGYAVATAADGAEAWRLLQEGECDLVVSDVEMPRMDGFALCRAIRASHRLRRLPVVLVTALETAEHRAEGLEAGADAYLPKSSFDQEGLLAVIRRLVG